MHRIINSKIIELTASEEAEVQKELDARKARSEAKIVENAWALIRKSRNERLKETDFFALSDVFMTDDMKTYRAALRDLPADTSDPVAFSTQWGEFENGKNGISDPWPTKP